MSNIKEKHIEWRRNKVYDYLVKGVNKTEIEELLKYLMKLLPKI
jgi:hypothetical protein